MPKSSFIVNSEFQPMSYQELLHPVVTQTQYQRELEEKYTQLDLQADKLEQLANSAVDLESYAKYKSYADRLRLEASNLAKYGLRGRDNARFMDLFRRYGKEIQPLLDAQAKRERLIAMQLQLSMQDPTSIYDRSAGNISLEELMANPSAAPVRQSGELLRALALAMAINLQNELKTAVIKKSDTPGYLAFRLKYGLSSEEVAAFVANPNSPNANRVLRAIFDSVLNASGVKESWEGNAYNQAVNYITMGLWSAIGKEAVQPLQDVWGLQQAQFAHLEKMLKMQLAHQARENAKNRRAAREALRQQTPDGRVSAWVLGSLSKKQQDLNRSKIQDFARKKYVILSKDGKTIERITDTGMKALFNREHVYKEVPIYGTGVLWATKVGTKKVDIGYKTFDQNFYSYLKSQGILKGTHKENGRWVTSRNEINKNLKTWSTNNELGFDLNYNGKIAQNWGPAGKGLLDLALASMSPGDIKKAGLSDNDFRNIQKGKLEYTLTDGKGITMRVLGQDGKYYDVPLTQTMNRSLYQTVTAGAQQAININTYLLKMLNEGAAHLPLGFGPDGKPTGYYTKPATQKDIADFIFKHLMDLDLNLIPQIYINQSTLYAPMSAKKVEFDPALSTAGMPVYMGDDAYGEQLDGFFGW